MSLYKTSSKLHLTGWSSLCINNLQLDSRGLISIKEARSFNPCDDKKKRQREAGGEWQSKFQGYVIGSAVTHHFVCSSFDWRWGFRHKAEVGRRGRVRAYIRRQWCGGGRLESRASSCIAHWQEGNAVFFFLKRKGGKSFILISSSLKCICFGFQAEIVCLFMKKGNQPFSLLSLFLYFLMCECDSDHLQWGTI